MILTLSKEDLEKAPSEVEEILTENNNMKSIRRKRKRQYAAEKNVKIGGE